MKKVLGLVMASCLVFLMFSLATATQQNEHMEPVRVASLKGPTSMGLVKMMKDHEGEREYEFTVVGTADVITPLIAQGEVDVAMIPCNLASVLYNKLGGKLKVVAVNTLGVLYVIEDGESIQGVEDLRGKKMLSMGKGTTPEYALNYVLGKNGIDPENDLEIEYKSEATEVAAAFGAGTDKIAMLPQPVATAVMMQNPGARVALSLTEEWEKVSAESALVTGVVVMRDGFLEERGEDAKAFLEAYAESVAYVNANAAEVAPWIEEIGIAKAAVAEKAIPLCNIVCVTGDEMTGMVKGYLGTLMEANAQAVGGKLPGDDFYATLN